MQNLVHQTCLVYPSFLLCSVIQSACPSVFFLLATVLLNTPIVFTFENDKWGKKLTCQRTFEHYCAMLRQFRLCNSHSRAPTVCNCIQKIWRKITVSFVKVHNTMVIYSKHFHFIIDEANKIFNQLLICRKTLRMVSCTST